MIKKYRDFSNNEIRAALDLADRQLREYITPVLDLKVDIFSSNLPLKRTVAADILNQVTPVVEQIKKLNLAVAARCRD